MKFLGIRNHHDCNITYTDGTKVRYLKLERLLQLKHFNIPNNTIITKLESELKTILDHAKVVFNTDFRDLDGVAFSVAPQNHYWPQIDQHYRLVTDNIWSQFDCPVFCVDHHYAHALSCWPLAYVENVPNHIVMDGSGDYGKFFCLIKNGILSEFIDMGDDESFSNFLRDIGAACGLEGNRIDFAGKLMALKALNNIPEDRVAHIMKMAGVLKFRQLRQFLNLCRDEAPLNKVHLAHLFMQEKLPEYLKQHIHPNETFTYSGGTAQNTLVNTEIRKSFPNVIIPPHCPDDGISLGLVEFLRQHFNQDPFDNSNFPFWQSDEAPNSQPSDAMIDQTAELLAQGNIVGWYQGHGELGPRALGNRSILMDPTIKGGKDIINSKVKRREYYRPFGASVLSEDVGKVFDCSQDSPYMLYVYNCLDKERYGSIVHVDGTCRIQTVNYEPQFDSYYRLLESFKRKTGIPMLLNTSLNVNGKPIAGHIDNAKELFYNTEMNALVIGNDLCRK